jgi:hypothetical protein
VRKAWWDTTDSCFAEIANITRGCGRRIAKRSECSQVTERSLGFVVAVAGSSGICLVDRFDGHLYLIPPSCLGRGNPPGIRRRPRRAPGGRPTSNEECPILTPILPSLSAGGRYHPQYSVLGYAGTVELEWLLLVIKNPAQTRLRH